MTENGEYKLGELLELMDRDTVHIGICSPGAYLGTSPMQRWDSLSPVEREQTVQYDGKSIRTRRGTLLFDVHRDPEPS
jgi:hypothetical protein